VAEVEAASFAQFLHAALAGCEASIRMGLALGRGHYQAVFHQTATAGAFGATVAAVLQMTPDARVHGHAIGLASTRASGLKSQFGTMGKPYNAGMAAATGVEAAQLAARGFISDPDGWDGPQGVIAVLHGDGAVSTEPGHFMTSVSHKFHACCHGLHAALEAFSTLAADPAGIDGIVVRTHPRWMNVCNKDDPQTGLEVKFSYRAVLALAACGHDTAKLATYSDSLARDAGLRVFRDKITVVADSSLTEMQAVVQVTSRTGTSEARHDLEQSIALVDRQARIRAKSAALLGNDMAKSLWEALHAERLATLIALMKG
jgi:2-methylcitrate dehydratase PrpD